MRSNVVGTRRRVEEIAKKQRHQAYRGYLAEDYDGIGQYILVALSRASTSSAFKARLAAGDFGTGVLIPVGTPVVLFSNRGQIEVLSLGAK